MALVVWIVAPWVLFDRRRKKMGQLAKRVVLRDGRTRESLSRTVSEAPWTGPRLRDRWVNLSATSLLGRRCSSRWVTRALRHCGLAPALRNIRARRWPGHPAPFTRRAAPRRAAPKMRPVRDIALQHHVIQFITGSTELKEARSRALNLLRRFNPCDTSIERNSY